MRGDAALGSAVCRRLCPVSDGAESASVARVGSFAVVGYRPSAASGGPATTYPKIQEWVARPLEVFRERLLQTLELWEVSVAAISQQIGMPKLAEALDALAEGDAGEADNRKARLVEIKAAAEVAEAVVRARFAPLNAQAVVTLWSLLETVVEDLLVAVLLNDGSVLAVPEIAGVRVEAGPMLTLSAGDRARYVFDQMESQQKAKFKSGVTRFEGLLGIFGLGTPVDEATRKQVYELGKVRDLLVHRDGMVDRAFAQACPWVPCSLTERLEVQSASVLGYATGAVQFSNGLVGVLEKRYPTLPVAESTQKTVKGRRVRAERRSGRPQAADP